MSFYLHVSTSLETLAGIFRETVYEEESGNNPLHPVVAAVQTQGIATWLKQYIASRSKIAMNIKMPFLKSAISQTICEYYPGAETVLNRSSVDRDTWRIFHYLSCHGGKGEFPELDSYLQNDPDMRKQYQISRQISATFEQYRTYRQEEMVQQWLSKNETPAHWQEKIFRELFADDETLDRYISHFIRQSENYTGEQFRKNLSVFGISSMPPLFLKFFLALSKYQDVNLFYLAPSAGYWENAKKGEEDGMDNPLLQAFGVQGRAFFNELLSSEAWNTAVEEHPEFSGRETFLSRLQSDIRNNINVEKKCSPDGTILIENCHTPLREIEILHDRLLHEVKESGRKPGEILVTAPDIENYVPYIETVFGGGPLAEHYTVADRSLKDSGILLPALLRILSLPESDYTNSDIFSLLEVGPLQKKFQLTGSDVQQLWAWCISSGIRWGIDGEHRKEKCGVNFEDFSWRQGVRRLLFGYAVGEDFESQLDLPELPLDFAEGTGAENLGKFLDFLDELFLLRDELAENRSPSEWFEKLKELPDRFFQPEEPSVVEERAQLIRFLAEQAYESDECEESVPFSVIIDILKGTELSGNSAHAFLRGKITFCSMVPMRTIPMPVIAILGLNAGEFPRRDIAAGFNLIAKDLRLTDRSKNLEDRYLLLETLLAAKEKLMIFYNGQSAKDNSEVFPTPPLAELIQYLDRLSGKGKREYLVKHRLQSYSESYFNGSDPLKFSYSESAFQAAEASRKPMTPADSSLVFPDLSTDDFSGYELPDRISLQELEIFFRSPAEYFLAHQNFGKFREFQRNIPEQNELFHPDFLSISNLKRSIVEYAADQFRKNTNHSIDFDYLRNYLTKTEQLPCGRIGEELFSALSLQTEQLLADSFLQFYTDQKTESFEFKCKTGTGKEIIFYGNALLSCDHKDSYSFRNASFKPKHLLNPWLRHVFLSAVLPEYSTTVCQAEDVKTTFRVLEQNQAQQILIQLALIRSAGKEKLIPFFSELKQVSETASGKRAPAVETETYKNSIVEAIGHDYCASLFFKKSDLNMDFIRKVCRATKAVYQGMETE